MTQLLNLLLPSLNPNATHLVFESSKSVSVFTAGAAAGAFVDVGFVSGLGAFGVGVVVFCDAAFSIFSPIRILVIGPACGWIINVPRAIVVIILNIVVWSDFFLIKGDSFITV